MSLFSGAIPPGSDAGASVTTGNEYPKITAFGDLRANGVRFARYLKERKGLDLQLVLRSGIDEYWAYSLSRPLDVTAPWVHVVKRPDGSFLSLIKYLGRMRRLSRNHPVLWGRSGGGIVSFLLGRTNIMQTVGSDVADIAYHQAWLRLLVLLSLKYARLILASQIRHLPILSALKTPHVFLPLPVWSPPNTRNMETARPPGFDLVFFTSAHMYWNGIREIPKGNDRFLHAFARFVRSTSNRVCLIAVEHGPDIHKARRLITKLGIHDHVFFKKPLTQAELARHYFCCDVVVDNFLCGEPGLLSLDAMAYGLPVMAYLDRNAANMAYGKDTPPVINVSTPEEIFDALMRLLSTPYRRDVGLSSKEWVARNHHPELASDIFLSALKSTFSHSTPP